MILQLLLFHFYENQHVPDIVLGQELLHVHDGVVDLLLPLALLGDGDGDDRDLLIVSRESLALVVFSRHII